MVGGFASSGVDRRLRGLDFFNHIDERSEWYDLNTNGFTTVSPGNAFWILGARRAEGRMD